MIRACSRVRPLSLKTTSVADPAKAITSPAGFVFFQALPVRSGGAFSFPRALTKSALCISLKEECHVPDSGMGPPEQTSNSGS